MFSCVHVLLNNNDLPLRYERQFISLFLHRHNYNTHSPVIENLVKGTLELEEKFGIGLQFDPMVHDSILMGKGLFYTYFIKEILKM